MNKITNFPEGNKDRSLVRLGDIQAMISDVDDAFQRGEWSMYTANLKRMQEVSALAMMRAMYIGKNRWIEIAEQIGTVASFYEYVQTEIGYVKRTVDAYVDSWVAVEETVKDYQKDSLLAKGISYIAPVAKAHAQDEIVVDAEFWDAVIECTSKGQVAQLIRDAKGEEPKKGTLKGKLDKGGSLVAWKDGQVYPVGFLDVNSTEPAVISLIKRICNNAGIEVE